MLRFDAMDGLRSADVARRCSGSGGTSRSLSLISLCMRLNVSGRGSPGTTFLLPLLCSNPPLDCGLSISFFAALSGLLFTGDGGSSSSRFSQVPSLLKLRRFHMLLFPTSVLARCRLLSLLVPPFAASSTGGIFCVGCLTRTARARRGVVAQPATPAVLFPGPGCSPSAQDCWAGKRNKGALDMSRGRYGSDAHCVRSARLDLWCRFGAAVMLCRGWCHRGCD